MRRKDREITDIDKIETIIASARYMHLGMFDDEMKQEELEKDECYGCAYGKCGPCIGICYKSMKA